MQDALAAGLIKELQPLFYIVGAVTILVFVTFGGGILKLILDAKKDRENRVDISLDGLKKAVIENTTSLIRLETKVDLITGRQASDLNNIARKVKEISS